MSESTTLDDVIILGRACPDELKDDRKTVCVGGYSHEHGFVRLYPTPVNSPMRAWDIVRVPVVRDPRDTRFESWKIQGSKDEWDRLSDKIEVIGTYPKKDRLALAAHLTDDCVKDVNDDKRSLGIVRPVSVEPYFAERTDYDAAIQSSLLGEEMFKTIKNYKLQPRIRYRCSGCKLGKEHDQQLLEWGVYEWIRKNPEKADQVWENLRLTSEKNEVYFFVGNQSLHRNAFMIISVIREPKAMVSTPLFPLKKFEPREEA